MGGQEQYDSFINQIKFEELKGNICIKGIVADDKNRKSFDGYDIVRKSDLGSLDLDCVIITNVMFHFHVAKQEVLSIIPNVKVISAKVFNIPLFDFGRYYQIIDKKISIIANTCWGGLTYNSLYMEFLSPFINLTISPTDYIKLLSNFQYYMSQELMMVKDRDSNGNPIGKLADIPIDFVHYQNFAEAKECWLRRVRKLNYENLFIYMPITDEETAEAFCELTIEHKYGFCNFKSAKNLIYMSDYECSAEVKRNFGGRGFSSYMNDQARRRLYDYDDELGNRGAKTRKVYDVLKLLSGENEYLR